MGKEKVIPWAKVGKLIMQWAQDEGTSDDLMELVKLGWQDDVALDKFWEEFEARIKKAFS